MTLKFKRNDTAYLIVKHRFKPTEYVKCKILMCNREIILEWDKKYEPWKIIETKKYIENKYTIETDKSETSHYSTNSKNLYIEYTENQLITIKEFRSVKLRKLSGKKYLNFPGKKFFNFNYLISFLKK